MPIISRIGRKSWGSRMALGIFYLVLSAGAVTMIYPLFLMLATSITGPPDIREFDLLPKFLYRDDVLFVRFLSEKYSGTTVLADHYGLRSERIAGFEVRQMQSMLRQLGGELGRTPPEARDAPLRRELTEYEAFLRESVPFDLLQLGFEQEYGVPRLGNRLYWRFLAERFNGSLEAMNAAYGENRGSFLLVRMPLERVTSRDWIPPQSRKYADFVEFKRALRASRPELFQSINGDVYWRIHLQDRYNGQIDLLNRAWGTSYGSFDLIRLPLTRPAAKSGPPFAVANELKIAPSDTLAEVWDDFVRRKWSPRQMQWDAPAITPLWQGYLRDLYTARAKASADGGADPPKNALALLNESHHTDYRTFEEVRLPVNSEMTGPVSADFYAFIRGDSGSKHLPDTSYVRLVTLAGSYREFLGQRYKTLADVNGAYGRNYAGWDKIDPPIAAYDWWTLTRNRPAWRWYWVTNNFRLVWDRIVVRGDALVNTFALVVLTIVFSLVVNPLCAYALSRFNLSYGYKILLFLLATMAFPVEVTMIPSFLLLRDLGLLNTFGALLLPGMVQGFTIFILKGFFDTLPPELYEAAQLDGAGELRMFWQITIPLCQPVLAYIALVSFMGAYTTFLFAMVICQDSRMWTLMVWIYQLQGSVHESAQIAALLIVMIPTLLVFLFCQKVIMRGIVLPQMG